MKLGLITLGCVKNEVDSEMLLGLFKKLKFELSNNLVECDTIVINTCGFIKSAKEEAISTILDVATLKETANLKHLIVVGCLAKRYKKDIMRDIPEADLVIGVDEYENIDQILSSYFNNSSYINNKLNFNSRLISSTFPMAYIRISDGCNNNCNYCAIPLIRGKLKSRKIEDILKEATSLVEKGIRELVIIAQDTTSYGIDIYGKPMLFELVRKLSDLEDLKWIRILYMYPGKITDELIDEFKKNNKLCRYFDIPLQHISDKMLKAMNRHTTKEETYKLLNKIRTELSDAIIRTTIMVGHPLETDQDFKELCDAVEYIKFDRLGGFAYSAEEDTISATMKEKVSKNVANIRLKKIMKLQKEILKESMKKRIGNVYEVILEDVSEDSKYFMARSYMDAPDVDPKMLIKIPKENERYIIGEYYKVKIEKTKGYDYICSFAE